MQCLRGREKVRFNRYHLGDRCLGYSPVEPAGPKNIVESYSSRMKSSTNGIGSKTT